MSETEIEGIIKKCLEQNRNAQKMLYKTFYSFAMGICLRYSNNRYEAAEIVNQGFLKVFTSLERYDNEYSIKAWLRKIMVNSSIDYYRSNLKMSLSQDLEYADGLISSDEDAYSKLKYQDLLDMIQQLSSGYRTVFNLFAIEGYSHEEISTILNINIGTSKSNLFKARVKLKAMILKANQA